MPSLGEIQRGLVAHAHGEPDALVEWLREVPGNGPGLDAYANASRTALRSALRDVFPVVAALTGQECFEGLARRYVALEPSFSSDIHAFGCNFPRFIASTEAQEALEYLVDVARLEWAWHESYHAPDEPPFDESALAAIPPEAWPQLRFRLASHCKLLVCRFPALAIWDAHQTSASDDWSLSIEEGEYRYLVYRPDNIPCIVSTADHGLLELIASSATLEQAFEMSCADPSAFARWTGAGVILGPHP